MKKKKTKKTELTKYEQNMDKNPSSLDAHPRSIQEAWAERVIKSIIASTKKLNNEKNT